ncbi:MAG: hypothetical protein KC416_11175 [Myxococcales bacterium]|nr:hypothetical protein [Myxococcales bacterium]
MRSRSTMTCPTAAVLLWMVCTGVTCGHTGQEFVEFDLRTRGTDNATFEAGAWTVTLTRAEVALGPIYFCATSAADAELCPSAVAEFVEVAPINGIEGSPDDAGRVFGVTGTVGSVTLDYGLPWLLTTDGPVPQEGAPGGHSAQFEGTASRDGATFLFAMDVDVTAANRGDIALPGIRTDHVIDTRTEAVTFSIDPTAWWANVDFEVVYADIEDPAVPIVLDEESTAYGTVILGMTTGKVPSLEWTP